MFLDAVILVLVCTAVGVCGLNVMCVAVVTVVDSRFLGWCLRPRLSVNVLFRACDRVVFAVVS